MINRIEFVNQLDRLTQVFSSLNESAIEEYYNKFKFFEIEIIREAIDILISDHLGDFTPKPAEFLGVINEIRRQSSETYPGERIPPPICEGCDGTGFKTWLGKHGRLKATPCIKCAKGKRIINAPIFPNPFSTGWREAYQKHKGRKKGKYEKEVNQAIGEQG